MIDHIVYGVGNLTKGMEKLHQLTGVQPTPGGKHLEFGTHNALLGLGQGVYLELIALDPENRKAQNKWMGMELLASPKVIRWAIKSDDIIMQAKILAEYKEELGIIKKGRRRRPDGSELSWKLTLPESSSEVEICPFLIDWGDSVHPADGLSSQCSISNMTFFHPKPKLSQNVLDLLSYDSKIIESKKERIEVTLNTPKGEIIL